jgi:6-phosphogluconolactonase
MDPYELDDIPPRQPDLPGMVVVGESVDDVVDAVATDLLTHATNCVRAFGDFHIALCGGQTPLPLYYRLMLDPRYRALPWRRTHLWLVDERRVPFDHDDSNWRHIREIIVDHADIPTPQVHPIFALSSDADTAYEDTLRETLGWREKGHDRIDYVLLGVGEDGHVGSIFPHDSVINERERLVRLAKTDPHGESDRVTLTLRMINAARFIAVCATGEHKHPIIKRLEAEVAAGRGELPALALRPLEGELFWYMDQAAASGVATADAARAPDRWAK